MKTALIHRATAAAAILFSAPLAVLGVYNFRSAGDSDGADMVARPGAGMPPAARPAEVRVPPGSGHDIQRAIASLPERGGRVILQAGMYAISEPVVIDRDNVELTGEHDRTILQLMDRADCPLLVIGSIETPVARTVTRVTVRRMTLDGNRFNQSAECNGGPCDNGGLSHIRNNALTIRGAEDVRVERVTARGARSGGLVLEKRCRRISVSDFVATGNHFDGLAAYETEESFFTRMHLHGNEAAGISADIRFNRNIVTHSRLENNGSQGIFMRDSNFNNFSGLTIRGNGAQGIFVAQADDQIHTPCTGNVFTGLDVSGCRGAGIRINDITCIANVVADSVFRGNGEGAVSESAGNLLARQNLQIH